MAQPAHDSRARMSPVPIGDKLVGGGVLVDVEAVLDRQALEQAGFRAWRL
jgi:hypothetical protein